MARYHEMLSHAMDGQGLRLKDVVDACEKISDDRVKIDITNLSRLRAGKQLPPQEPNPKEDAVSTNRVLAKVLGIDEERFVLAAALEHTPLPVLEFLGSTMHIGHMAACYQLSETVDAALALVRDIETRSGVRVTPQAEEDLTLKTRTLSLQLYGSEFFFGLVHEVYTARTGRDLLREIVIDDEATTSTLVDALADVARIPKRALMAFVRAMQIGNE